MRFTKDNVNLDKLEQTVEVMNGSTSRLQRINTNEVDTLVNLFQAPDVYTSAHLEEAPDREKLERLLQENYSLLMWRAFPTDGQNPTGPEIAFIGWVSYAGPPFLFVIPTTDTLDLEVLRDGIEQLLRAYFECTGEDEIYFYADVPVPEDIHATLVENGFDLWQEVAGVDPEKEATYIMERATYNAYFGDDAELDDAL